jgi:Fe-S-cluster-containing hydrogenase component 2
MSTRVFAIADQAIVDPITIVPELCTGCNLCLHVCPVDLFLPNDARADGMSVRSIRARETGRLWRGARCSHSRGHRVS